MLGWPLVLSASLCMGIASQNTGSEREMLASRLLMPAGMFLGTCGG